jgi:DNA polymerase (family X)
VAKRSNTSPPKRLGAAEVARALAELGQRTALAGGNPYSARAYERAAQSLAALTTPLGDVIAKGELRDIPGVGPAIAEAIRELHETGTHARLEALRGAVPAGVLEMLRIPGLKPDKILRLHRDLGIASVGELEHACRDGRLQDKKGFGPALQKRVLQGLETLRHGHGQRHIHRAAQLLERAQRNLERSHPELRRVVAAGDFRRGCELVADLCLVAEAPQGTGIETIQLSDEITLVVAEPSRYGSALLFATGSPEHLQQLQALAREHGFALDATELRRGKRKVACPDEETLYKALGLPFIAPELREGRGEIESAAAGRLPRLVEPADLRGLLHCHTDASDGANDLKTMAEATRKRGYTYFGVADHSRSAGYAGGLSLEEIAAQHVRADELNRGYRGRFRIFKGIESDILGDGSLDYPDEVLRGFDFVVASVHSQFRLPKAAQTARIIRAVRNPHTTILGHMTGRMLLRRPGYEVDIEAILEACAECGVAVEINGNPHRLDLDWRWHQRALELGCMLSINPDAHSTAELDLAAWGVVMARKGGVPRERVLNCLDRDALSQHFETRKQPRRAGSHTTRARNGRKPIPSPTTRTGLR